MTSLEEQAANRPSAPATVPGPASTAAPAPVPVTVPAPARPLRSRAFALFFAARAASKLGETMLPVALSAGLLQHGMGASEVGLAMASTIATCAVFIVFGGVFSDRFNTLRLMVGSDAVRVLTQAVTAVLFLTGHVVLWQICLIGAVNGIATGLFQPGVASTIPRVADDVQAANGTIRIGESLAMLAGPAVAGLLVAVADPAAVFAAHAAAYAISTGCLALLRLPPTGEKERGPRPATTYWSDLAEGWREFRSRTWLWGTIVIWMFFMVTAWGPIIPLTSVELIGGHGARTYGLISSALGLGTALGAVPAMRLRPARPLRAGALALLGTACFPAAVGAQLPVSALLLASALTGAGMGFWSVMWATSVQTRVPGPVLSRLHAYEVAGSVAMLPVGQALAGPAAVLFGARTVLLAGGALTLVVVAALLCVPAIRGLKRV
ncbi:MFS transporter [Streptomyces sp. NPDC058657]|uniref:MFS transporter n=1 Tax=unclassified Streptomyces TaxID=2593676 RepID=UPI0036641C70